MKFLHIHTDFKVLYLNNESCVINTEALSGHFQYFRYPRDVTLQYVGWTPYTWRDSVYEYVIGLPNQIYDNEDNLVIINQNTNETHVFKAVDGLIEWRSFFQGISEEIFYEDLD